MKTCTKCKVPKKAVEYSKDRSRSDGLQNYCKACAKVANIKTGADGMTNGQRGDRKKGADGMTKIQRWNRKKGADGLTNRQRRDRKRGEDDLTDWQRRSRKKGADGLTYHQRGDRKRGGTQARNLKVKYGLSLEQFDEMILNQGGMCAICEKSTKLCVDHNHATEKIRGLLCRACNTSLGGFSDSSSILARAIDYLKKHA